MAFPNIQCKKCKILLSPDEPTETSQVGLVKTTEVEYNCDKCEMTFIVAYTTKMPKFPVYHLGEKEHVH